MRILFPKVPWPEKKYTPVLILGAIIVVLIYGWAATIPVIIFITFFFYRVATKMALGMVMGGFVWVLLASLLSYDQVARTGAVYVYYFLILFFLALIRDRLLP